MHVSSIAPSAVSKILRAADAATWAHRVASNTLGAFVQTEGHERLASLLTSVRTGALLTGHAAIDRALLHLSVALDESETTEARAQLRLLLPDSAPSTGDVAVLLYPGVQALLARLSNAPDHSSALLALSAADQALSTVMTLWYESAFDIPEDIQRAASAADWADGPWRLVELYRPGDSRTSRECRSTA